MDSGEYKKTLDILFPWADAFGVDEVNSVVYDEEIKEAPLFTKIFSTKTAYENDNEDMEKLYSAWANLMLELGEFKLDKLKAGIEKEIPFITTTSFREPVHNIPYALFESPGELLDEIWKRILGDDMLADTLIAFIDDDPGFEKRYGFSKGEIYWQSQDTFKLGTKLLINLGDKDYNEKKYKRVIKKIVKWFEKEEKKEKKLVFIVDLLYKKENIDIIAGGELIRYIREELPVNPLIIGFTGGKSHFIINSAVKAGADNVIMKKRGDSSSGRQEHSGSSPGGLFDLLWAISKNISRWRFLESYKELVRRDVKKEGFVYKPVLDELFFSIENESNFWRSYLTNWQREIEDIRLKAILIDQNESD